MKHNLNVELKKIGPEEAARILTKNPSNRRLTPEHVKRLAQEMTEGRWKFNGDTICFNGTGNLLNGQHRLHAIVKSGVTVTCLVVEGLPSDVFDTIDIGKRRSGGDTLSSRGEVDCNNLASTLQLIDRYMTSRLDNDGGNRYTNHQLIELLDKYGDARDSVRKCCLAVRKARIIPASLLAACHYLFSKKDPIAADAMIEGIAHGKMLHEGDPVYVLRELLMRNSLATAKLSRIYLFACVVKAWNRKREGGKLLQLRFAENESFPVIK